ncbi:arm repeat protein [Stylonychia lemnae]|uniref:Arm repeat protein n=1 Tax=Stylonychia lemnae TaxID=5949 RepID=A0A077ZX22_STYLE|nr:arm repeat protein [Stylonychia lemnae]|eukprot:CDW74435.1 arm repeat protein [Stylonychia lemnae]
MSQTTSPAILKALSAIVNDSLNYVSLIEYMEEQYYLVLGRFSFYFIKNDLSLCQASIKYAHLEKCLTDEKKVSLVQIQLSDNRDPTHPQKLNIYSQDRITLIDSFICYWQIDYMYRYRTFAKFPLLLRQKIDIKGKDFSNISSSRHQSKIPSKILAPPVGYKALEFKGYKFFIPKLFIRKKGKESEYINVEQKENVVVQISDCSPIDNLCKMPDYRKDIQEFAQNLAMSRIDAKTQYYIMASKPYIKKYNLTSDKAQINCWDVHIRTHVFDLFVTVHRRKYIPPLMEVFQDIVVISIFDFHNEHGHVGEYRSSDNFFQMVHHLIVDSIYPIQRQNLIYKNIIEERSNALLMDEDTMNFYHYNLNIQPIGITYAVNYLRSILSILSRYNGEYPKELNRQLKNMKLVRKDEYIEKPPGVIVSNFEEVSFRAKDNSNWTQKIARYLSHILNGGLLQSQFTFQTFIKMIQNVTESQDEMNLKDELVYLLHIREKNRGFQRTGEPITTIIKNFIGSNEPQMYNENVLIVMIESGYLQQEFSFLNPKDYPDFLIHILKSSERIKVKEAACRKIIKLFAEKKKENGGKGPTTPGGGVTAGGPKHTNGGPSMKKADESSKIEFINLVEPLINTMKTGNYNLASLSTQALVNLCNYSDDIKDIFIQKQGLNAILEYLTCKEEDTLLNILKLLQALINKSETIGKQISEENNNECVHSLLRILQGPDIPMTKFSLKITFLALQILRALIQYSLNAKSLFIDNAGAIEAVIKLIRIDQILTINEVMEMSIYSFLTQMVREENDYKRIIGKKVLPICNERLQRNSEIPLTGSMELKFFKMMSVLVKNCKENIYIVKGMKDRLTNYLSNDAKELRIKNKIYHIISVVESFDE